MRFLYQNWVSSVMLWWLGLTPSEWTIMLPPFRGDMPLQVRHTLNCSETTKNATGSLVHKMASNYITPIMTKSHKVRPAWEMEIVPVLRWCNGGAGGVIRVTLRNSFPRKPRFLSELLQVCLVLTSLTSKYFVSPVSHINWHMIYMFSCWHLPFLQNNCQN